MRIKTKWKTLLHLAINYECLIFLVKKYCKTALDDAVNSTCKLTHPSTLKVIHPPYLMSLLQIQPALGIKPILNQPRGASAPLVLTILPLNNTVFLIVSIGKA